MTDRTVKNPSPEELEELKNKDTVKASGRKHNTPAQVADNIHWKPASSRFEPKPHFFKLPSLTFTGAEHIENDGIYVKRFSTTAEGIFADAIQTFFTEKDPVDFFKQINLILNDCIRSKVDIEQLATIDQVALLMFVIGISYGVNSEFEIECEGCHKTYHHTIDITKDIEIKYLPKNFKSRVNVIFDQSGFVDPVRAEMTFPRLKHQRLFIDPHVDRVEQYKSLLNIEQPDDISDDEYEAFVVDVINNLSKEDKEKIKVYLEEFNNYGATMNIVKRICENADCKMCGKERKLPIELGDIFQALI